MQEGRKVGSNVCVQVIISCKVGHVSHNDYSGCFTRVNTPVFAYSADPSLAFV